LVKTETNLLLSLLQGPVFTVMFYKNYVISGGRDGVIHSWVFNKNMDPSASVKVCVTLRINVD